VNNLGWFENTVLWMVISGALLIVCLVNKLLFARAARKRTAALEQANRELLEQRKRLESINREMEANFEELKRLNKQLEIADKRLSKALELLYQLSDPNISAKSYFANVLTFAIEIISSADKGSIFLRSGDKWRIVTAVGHDIERIAQMHLTVENFFVPSKALITKHLKEWHRAHDSPADFSTWTEFLGDIRETLVVPLKEGEKVFGVMNLDISYESPHHFSNEDLKLAQRFAKMASSFHMLREYSRREGQFHRKVALTIVKALEYYDTYTRGHSERVARYATLVADKMKLPRELIRRLYWAALLHDIGKIFVPQAVLNKPSKLEDDEYKLVKIHPVKSEELIREIEGMEDIALWVRHHHERWDGGGYPDGLAGEAIPLLSRILAVVDSFDAMTTERPYKRALNKQEAIRELLENAGKQFDPKVTEVMIQLLNEMKESSDHKMPEKEYF